MSQTPLPQASTPDGKLAHTFTRTVANTDIVITVQGADNLAGSWTDLAAIVKGAATAPVLAGVAVTETGSGATRTVEVRDLYLTSDSLHPRRAMRVQVRRP